MFVVYKLHRKVMSLPNPVTGSVWAYHFLPQLGVHRWPYGLSECCWLVPGTEGKEETDGN